LRGKTACAALNLRQSRINKIGHGPLPEWGGQNGRKKREKVAEKGAKMIKESCRMPERE